MKNVKLTNSLILLLAAVIWGFAFVAQSAGMDYVGPFTFNCVRCIIGGIVLIPCIFLFRCRKWAESVKGGIVCGVLLCIATNFQQFGIMYTTVGKAGFITTLYVVMVPIIGLLFKKKPGILVWVSVAISVAGMYLLCMTDSLALGRGDMLILICAFAFSLQIMAVDHFAPAADGVIMSCVQFFTCGILSGICMLIFEEPSLSGIYGARLPILYAGVMSCGVAYTLQVIGQKDMNPTVASLILCLESVVSAIAGWIILDEALTAREIAGCAMMLGAIVLAQLPARRRKAALSMLMVMFIVSGCAMGQKASLKGTAPNEILTTTPVNQNKMLITVMVSSGMNAEIIEEVIEEGFTDVDIVLVHNGTKATTYSLEKGLINKTACDMIFSRDLQAVNDIAPEYLYDLSSQDFIGNYYLAAITGCTNKDGKVYYLPGPSDIYGVVYNKTMFEENGWELPHSYSEFVQLIDSIDEAGYISLQPSIMWPDSFQIVFNTFSYDEVIKGVDNFEWRMNYQNGEGLAVEHLEPAAMKLIKLFDDGILSLEDWNVKPRERSVMMYSDHTTAMIFECQNAVNYNKKYSGENGYNEIGMFPFWTSDEPDSDYLYSIPSYFMGITNTAVCESKEKKEMLLDILAYISTSDVQQKLMSGGIQVSNVKKVPLVTDEFSEAVKETIDEGRIISNFYYGTSNLEIEEQLRTTVPALINGEITITEWLAGADKVRDKYLNEDSNETVYGQVERTLTKFETAHVIGDMYRKIADADIGLVLVGNYYYSVNERLYGGDITDESILCISPDKGMAKENDMGIAVSRMTGRQIIEILNSTPSTPGEKTGKYPYMVASGLMVEYAPWAGDGEKVISCKLPDGSSIDMDAYYNVAYFNHTLDDYSIVPDRMMDISWSNGFIAYIDINNGTINAPELTTTLVWGK